jgi:hypothetical protein
MILSEEHKLTSLQYTKKSDFVLKGLIYFYISETNMVRFKPEKSNVLERITRLPGDNFRSHII